MGPGWLLSAQRHKYLLEGWVHLSNTSAPSLFILYKYPVANASTPDTLLPPVRRKSNTSPCWFRTRRNRDRRRSPTSLLPTSISVPQLCTVRPLPNHPRTSLQADCLPYRSLTPSKLSAHSPSVPSTRPSMRSPRLDPVAPLPLLLCRSS